MTTPSLPAAPQSQMPFVPMWNYGETQEQMVDDQSPVEIPIAHVNFLEANTDSITIEELSNDCIVPTWGSQELTVSHQDFINTVQAAAKKFFIRETITEPEIRVSHEVKGRIPSALWKTPSELLPSDKTKFYQRLAFAFTIPSIHESINGQVMQLCIAGVRNYNELNLYRANRGFEKFSVAIGWRVNVCSNQVLTCDGLRYQMDVTDLTDLHKQVTMLFQSYNPAKDLYLMQNLTKTFLSESQFAQIVGRCRLYQALTLQNQRVLPRLLITDSQINNVCKGFFANPDFGAKGNRISMWDFHNLLTESNKSSYIDTYLQRAVNATEVAVGINAALNGTSNEYEWFLG